MSSNVQQSGNVTNGHLAKWITGGVLADAGPQIVGQRVLAILQGADFNFTGDQPIVIPSTIQAFQLTGLLITNASESITTAQGGFYPAPSKGGTAIVANTQVYSSLTGSGLLLLATLSSFANTSRFSSSVLSNNSIYFSLSTPQGSLCNADIYAIGVDLTIGF